MHVGGGDFCTFLFFVVSKRTSVKCGTLATPKRRVRFDQYTLNLRILRAYKFLTNEINNSKYFARSDFILKGI